MAIQVLKRAGEHDLQVAAVEVDVSWTLIASLMTLGPNFVQTYLSQLLVLWRNALPKPTSKDTTTASGRNPLEWSFLLHVRESALSAILCFLRHNSPVLVSLDVARRLSSLLNNALQFSVAFLTQNNDEQLDQPVASEEGVGLTLRIRESLLRRRIYQCFSSIGFAGITEATQSSLLQSTITLFASAEGYAGSPVQAAIVSSSGSFNSIWQSTDGYAYGLAYSDTQIEGGEFADKNNSNKDVVETYFDELVGVAATTSFPQLTRRILADTTNPRILRTRSSYTLGISPFQCSQGLAIATSPHHVCGRLCDSVVLAAVANSRPGVCCPFSYRACGLYKKSKVGSKCWQARCSSY
jgi:HEAT repeat-containing protein 5